MAGDRVGLLLEGIRPTDRLIEIGPSFNPVAPKSAGWQVTVVDHASQAGLVEKYTGNPHVDVRRIEAVDVVWQGGPLETAVPAADHGRYAALIASHVIEHIPDVIGFLRSVQVLLHPTEGRLILAVPDKRFCFDVFRPVSTTGHLLAAHKALRGRHIAAHMFDHVAYKSSLNGQGAWARQPLGDGLRLDHSLDQAMAQFEAITPDGDYVDCHAWQFTPASFALLILELSDLGLIDWQVEWSAAQPATEFLVRLRRGRRHFASAEAREAARLALLREMLLELREQTDWMIDASAPASAAAPMDLPARLDAIDARLRTLAEETLPPIALSAAEARAALRPARAAWRRLLPLRRVVARWRGRG